MASARAWRTSAWVTLLMLPAACVLFDCRGATQLTLEITTDFDCVDGDTPGAGNSGVQTSIRIGRPGQLNNKEAVTVTGRCTNRRVGALVVVPSGEKDEEIAVEVTSGVGVRAEDCSTDPRSCIFARRSLRYLAHNEIVLPVVMRASCVGQVCDPTSTCVQGGCVPAQCPPGAPCTEETLVPGLAGTSDAAPQADGAPLPDAADADAGPVDAKTDTLNPYDGPVLTSVESIATNGSHTCALYQAGEVRCWGSNTSGQLGNGTAGVSNATPALAKEADSSAIRGARMLAAGGGHTCIMRADGGVDCWGRNVAGELNSSGSMQPFLTPHRPPYAGNATGVFLGLQSSCFTHATGPATCFGTSAVTVNVPAIRAPGALGECHGCYAGADGGVSCWGDQAIGRLGNGKTDTAVPVTAPNVTPGTEVSAAFNHACAISAGEVRCWGSWLASADCNTSDASAGVVGQLFSSTPLMVNLPPGRMATHIAVGRSHACVLLDDTTVACWGEQNDAGQLGTADLNVALSPSNLLKRGDGTTLTGIKQVTTGSSHSCALLQNGQVMCWGNNANGQLGSGSLDTMPHPVPQLVVGL